MTQAQPSDILTALENEGALIWLQNQQVQYVLPPGKSHLKYQIRYIKNYIISLLAYQIEERAGIFVDSGLYVGIEQQEAENQIKLERMMLCEKELQIPNQIMNDCNFKLNNISTRGIMLWNSTQQHY